jgi:hypothetical protein
MLMNKGLSDAFVVGDLLGRTFSAEDADHLLQDQ